MAVQVDMTATAESFLHFQRKTLQFENRGLCMGQKRKKMLRSNCDLNQCVNYNMKSPRSFQPQRPHTTCCVYGPFLVGLQAANFCPPGPIFAPDQIFSDRPQHAHVSSERSWITVANLHWWVWFCLQSSWFLLHVVLGFPSGQWLHSQLPWRTLSKDDVELH